MPHKYVLAINNGGVCVRGRQVQAEWGWLLVVTLSWTGGFMLLAGLPILQYACTMPT